MHIIGISCFYHDSSAAILKDDNILAAVQEERFSRIKHDSNFPMNSIKFCLQSSNKSLNDIDYLIFYEKPLLKFTRLLETYISTAPKGFKSFKMSIPLWLKQKLFQKQLILNELKKIEHDGDFEKKILFAEHHQSHAASAFYPSPFEEAVILTMDATGEWTTTSVAYGKGNKMKILREIHFPHSIGLLYSAFTYHLGFKVNSGEYKVMGLAPYGKPVFKNKILEHLIDIKSDGSFRLNMKYFNYCSGLTMTNKKFDELFEGRQPRKPEVENIQVFHMNMAASIQEVIDMIVLRTVKHLSKEFSCENLCLAGGVALNCVTNGKLKKENYFKNIWFQPASGDAGGSIGAAFLGYYHYENNKRKNRRSDRMQSSYLGPSYSNYEIENFLKLKKVNYSKLKQIELIKTTTRALIDQKAIGWMQGKLEFGPRALGNRSILADPRSEKMQNNLNLKIKFRESFRPFAPSILFEELNNWFDLDIESPYMLLVANAKISENKNNTFKIPAVTHVDKSARIQTVKRKDNEIFYELIKEFFRQTKCPILVNTSFNIRGEPIVCSPEDAYNCFMGTNLDVLVMESFFIDKKNNKSYKTHDYKNKFALD